MLPGSLQTFGSVGRLLDVLFWILSQPALKLCKMCRLAFLMASGGRAGPDIFVAGRWGLQAAPCS